MEITEQDEFRIVQFDTELNLTSQQIKQISIDMNVLSIPVRLAILDQLLVHGPMMISEIDQAIRSLPPGLQQDAIVLHMVNMIETVFRGNQTVHRLTQKGYGAMVFARSLIE
jgi:hypothetical protein